MRPIQFHALSLQFSIKEMFTEDIMTLCLFGMASFLVLGVIIKAVYTACRRGSVYDVEANEIGMRSVNLNRGIVSARHVRGYDSDLNEQASRDIIALLNDVSNKIDRLNNTVN